MFEYDLAIALGEQAEGWTEVLCGVSEILCDLSEDYEEYAGC